METKKPKPCEHVWEYTRDKRNKQVGDLEWAWFLCSRCETPLWAQVKQERPR